MQVFKTYFRIMDKHKSSIFIYVVLFLCLALIRSSNLKTDEEYEEKKVGIMVINEDGENTLIEGFLEYLADYVYFIEPKEDMDAVREALFFREAVYVLIIPEGFSESLVIDGAIKLTKQTVPDSVKAMSLDTVINNYFNMARVYLKQFPALELDKLNDYISNTLDNETEVISKVEVEIASNEFNAMYYNFLAYVILVVFITAISILMFAFNGVEIRRKHAASPIANRTLNIWLIIANSIFALSFVVLFIIMGCVINRNGLINLNTIFMWVNAFVFATTALSISYLIGITINSRKAIGAVSTAISLGLSFISGVFIPQEFLNSAVLRVASFMPTYWYAKANNTLQYMTSFGWNELSEVLGYMAIQIGFTIAFISVALVISKKKTQQAV